jgi:hypothetical protein
VINLKEIGVLAISMSLKYKKNTISTIWWRISEQGTAKGACARSIGRPRHNVKESHSPAIYWQM